MAASEEEFQNLLQPDSVGEVHTFPERVPGEVYMNN